MTTYTYDGFYLDFSDVTDDAITLDPVQISVVTRPGSGVLTYQFDGPPREDGLRPAVDVNDITYTTLADGIPLSDFTPYIARLTWGVNNETFLLIFDSGEDEYIFVLGGDTLPFDTLAEFNDFNDNQVTGVFNISSGPFAPNTPIDLSSLPGVQITDDDLIFGTDEDDDLLGGIGNDTVFGGVGDDTVLGGPGRDHIFGEEGDDSIDGGTASDTLEGGSGSDVLNGGPGEDLIFGGGGNDVINPGADPDGGGDIVVPGLGNDTVILTDINAPGQYVSLVHADLAFGISVFIDATANTGRIEKSSGTTTLVDVNTAMSGDGMDITGTSVGDTYNITPLPGGFIALRSTEGADAINLGTGNGIVRLDYSNAPGPILANLGNGTIEDGFGFTDTVTTSGARIELRGTMMTDTITGSSNDERFILRGGDDILDAGGGYDVLRYDRNGVEGLVVDLQAGTATGIWDGEAFTHTISGVEEVRGTRDGDDVITGSDSADEEFQGRGGDDTLDGGGGDDTIDGGEGNDVGVIGVGLNEISSVTRNSDGSITVVSTQGTDTFIDIESFDLNGTILTDAALLSQVVSTTPTNGDDLLTGDVGNDPLNGLAGDDTLIGLGGDDTLNGGDGNDVGVIGVGLNEITSATRNPNGSITVVSTQGTDTFIDIEFYDLNGTLVTETALLNGPFSTTPTSGDDIITGDDGNDKIDGGEGNDTINGGPGDDGLKGRDGDDLLIGGPGNDRLPGEGGNDTIIGNDGDDRLGGGFGNDLMIGGNGNDGGGAGPGNDTVFGGAGDDVFNGGYGHDYIDLGPGNDRSGASFANDTMFGGSGDDLLTGGDGDDLIFGEEGADTINSGNGEDTVTGGAGADTFLFNSLYGGDTTVITDFEDGIDVIRVVGLRSTPDQLGRLDITDITYNGAPAASFTYGNHEVIVEGVSASDLSLADFLFT